MRRLLVRAGLVLLLGVVALLAVPVARVAPLVADDLALDRIVVAVVLDWRDFGEEKARERLGYELDHRGVGAQLDERDCAFVSDPATGREVVCSWEVEVQLPLGVAPLPLAFESRARVDRRGVLLR